MQYNLISDIFLTTKTINGFEWMNSQAVIQQK